MKSSWIRHITPAVSLRSRLAVAGVFWVVAGGLLLYRGITFLYGSAMWIKGVAVIVGILKGRFLARAALKNIKRLQSLPGKRCIGGVYSWRSWMFVVSMSFLGIWLRRSHVDPVLYGAVLMAVGLALLYGSLPCFAALKKHIVE